MAAGMTTAATPQGDEPVSDDGPMLRIGEAAAQAGVSTRTLRYYQELGLLSPSRTTAGGARRYSKADVERVMRILQLRDLVGLNLHELAGVLHDEDRLIAIRQQWWNEQGGAERRATLLREAIDINTQTRELVRAKMAGLQEFLAGLDEHAELLQQRKRELEAEPSGDDG
jgi:DNA-binding transcriptional MerR regulator